MKMDEPRITMSAPDITEADVQAVAEVVRSGRLAMGPKTEAFEGLIADYVGLKHAVAASSGTTALHMVVRALGIGPGDEVLVPSFTFAASVNVLFYEGATPVFVDVESETYNLDPEDVVRKVSRRTKAIMAVDAFGHPAAWDGILHIAQEHELRVIDDSCEALGAAYKRTKLGQFGDAATFAFYPNKQMTTGEGGMIVTGDARLAKLCRSLRNQGRGAMGAWLSHERLGYNYRMTEMSAALGVSQMGRIDELLAKRARVAAMYTKQLSGLDWVRPPIVRPEVEPSWFVYVVTLGEGLERDEIIRRLADQGIPSRGYFAPVHLQPYVRELLGSGEGDLPVTEEAARRTVALPFHGNMATEQIDQVVEALRRACER